MREILQFIDCSDEDPLQLPDVKKLLQKEIWVAFRSFGEGRYWLANGRGRHSVAVLVGIRGTIGQTRREFGVGAIDGMARTFSGKITRHWKPEGLVCELSFPSLEVN